MTEYFYEHAVRKIIREQGEWDRRMEHQGWFRRPAPTPLATRWLMVIGGLLIRLGTRLQDSTRGGVTAQDGRVTGVRTP